MRATHQLHRCRITATSSRNLTPFAITALVANAAAGRDIEDVEAEERREASKQAFRAHVAARSVVPPAKKQGVIDDFLGKRQAVP